MKVKVEVDKKLFDLVSAKMPWLSYENIEQFINEAVSLRFENLLKLVK